MFNASVENIYEDGISWNFKYGAGYKYGHTVGYGSGYGDGNEYGNGTGRSSVIFGGYLDGNGNQYYPIMLIQYW